MGDAGTRLGLPLDGAPIARANGFGRTAVGIGTPTSHGGGPVTIMVIGSTSLPTVGFGFRASNGRRPGSSGVWVVVT